MRDNLRGRAVKVSTDGTSGPYIAIDPKNANRVAQALVATGITFSTDPNAIQLDGQTAATIFNFGKGANIAVIQHVLDSLMTFDEYNLPAVYRAAVDEFEREVESACNGIAISHTEVKVETDDRGRELIVFILHDAIGNNIARVECAPDEAPREIGRRAYRQAGSLIHTSGA